MTIVIIIIIVISKINNNNYDDDNDDNVYLYAVICLSNIQAYKIQLQVALALFLF